MKILLAVNNEYITDKVKEKYNENVFKYDLLSMEEVIEFLRDNDIDILITKDNLEGNLDKKMYIRQIKLLRPNIKIINIVEELDNEYKKFLFANEVFNIINSSNLTIDKILNSIEEEKVVYVNDIEHINKQLNEPSEEYKSNNQIIAKRKIAIYGTSGSGKSYVSSVISKEISKKIKISISLLDMDIENPAIDIYNNIDEKNDGLNQIIDDIDKRKSIDNVIDNYMIKDKDNKNLWYMTNNVSIFDMQNKLSNKYYEKIYNIMYENFDYVLIDLPSSPFLDVVPYTLKNCDYIFFVVNPNYASIRQGIKYLELLNKLWGIPKDKIKIIVNKIQKNSLDNIQIKNLLVGYDIILNIPYFKEIDSYVNGALNSLPYNYDLKELYNAIGIRGIDNDNNIFSIKNILRKVGVASGS